MDIQTQIHRIKNNHNLHNKLMTIFVVVLPLLLVTYYLFTRWGSLEANQMPVLVALLSAVYAMTIAFFTIKTQRRISREKNSIDFEASYRTKKIDKAWGVIRSPIQDLSSTEFYNLMKSDIKIRKSIVRILNEWERAASGVFSELFDEDFLYKAYGTNVLQIFRVSSSFILEKQNDNPRILTNFTRLAVRWQIRRTAEEISDAPKKLTNSLRELHVASANLDLSFQTLKKTKKPNAPFLKEREQTVNKLKKLSHRKADLNEALKPFG